MSTGSVRYCLCGPVRKPVTSPFPPPPGIRPEVGGGGRHSRFLSDLRQDRLEGGYWVEEPPRSVLKLVRVTVLVEPVVNARKQCKGLEEKSWDVSGEVRFQWRKEKHITEKKKYARKEVEIGEERRRAEESRGKREGNTRRDPSRKIRQDNPRQDNRKEANVREMKQRREREE